MDTNLGVYNITKKQFSQTEKLKSELIRGFSLQKPANKLVVVSTRELTESETNDLIGKINTLPDEWTEEALIVNFNAETAIGREAQVFNETELTRLMPYSYTINELIRYKNFWGGISNGNPYVGLKQVGMNLVNTGQILQSDYDKLNGILMEQGIDLNAH